MFKRIREQIRYWYSDIRFRIYLFTEGVKNFLPFRKVAFSIMFDNNEYTSVLMLEKYQLERLYNAIAKGAAHDNYKRDLYWINICLRLLHTLLRGHIKRSTYVNTKRVEDETLQRLRNKIILNGKINICDIDFYENLREEIYLEKAWHLYCRIRENYMRNWWN